MSQSAHPIDTSRTNIVLAYKNEEAIADKVCPRLTPGGSSKFSYDKYDVEQSLTIPDTLVGRKGKTNEVDFKGTTITDSTENYALEDGVPQDDIDSAPSNIDPLGFTSEGLTDLIILDREVRTAKIFSKAGSYSYKETVPNDQKFDGSANGLHKYILAKLNEPLVRPNEMVFGQAEWTAFSTHPDIVSSILGNDGSRGIVTPEQVAKLFQLKAVHVGSPRVNIKKPNSTAKVVKAWDGLVAAYYNNPVQARAGGLTFAFTQQFGERFVMTWPDKNIGARGGTRVRVGESVKELVVAPSAGFLFQSPLR